jgi:DNA-binding protein YbaB
MARDIDEAWIDEAIERYRRVEERLAEVERSAKGLEVTVRSPDGLVELVVAADGTVTNVRFNRQGRGDAELERAVCDLVAAAANAAAWARQKLHEEIFDEYRPLA